MSKTSRINIQDPSINANKLSHIKHDIESTYSVYNPVKKTVTKSSALIEINDAIEGLRFISLPANCDVHSRNMYKINAYTKTSHDVTFTVDNSDPNTVVVDGTASANAWSYGTITTSNAENLLEAGTYWIAYYDNHRFAPRTARKVLIYMNIIDYSTGTSTYEGIILNSCYRLKLATKSYVALRLQVPLGNSVSNMPISIYFSKLPPLPIYTPYDFTENTMHEYIVIDGSGTGDIEYYAKNESPASTEITVTTFNLGGYNHGTNTDADMPDVEEYFPVISKVDTDLLCTQEDRIYYTSGKTVNDMFFKNVYANGDIGSYKSSTPYFSGGNGIYSNYPLAPCGAYTFGTQGTETEYGETTRWSSFAYSFMLLNGHTVLVISAHLSSKYWNGTAREAQIQEILDFVETAAVDYVIICGDFNTWYANTGGKAASVNPTYPDEFANFVGAFTSKGFMLANDDILGTKYTYHAGNHVFDNILVKNLTIRDIKVYVNSLNDHYAFKATVFIN